MSKLTLALFLVAFAVSFPRTCGATNYHEYKKFNLPVPTENCRANAMSIERSVGILTATSSGSYTP